VRGDLLADSQALDDLTIALGIAALHVVEQATALADEPQPTATAVVILGLGREVSG